MAKEIKYVLRFNTPSKFYYFQKRKSMWQTVYDIVDDAAYATHFDTMNGAFNAKSKIFKTKKDFDNKQYLKDITSIDVIEMEVEVEVTYEKYYYYKCLEIPGTAHIVKSANGVFALNKEGFYKFTIKK